MLSNINDSLYGQIVEVLNQTKSYAFKAVNFAAVFANWHIGRLIVEEEQNGKERAEYGTFLINHLSKQLTNDYGKGYDPTNLKLFRKFYLEFPIWIPINEKGDISSNLFSGFPSLAIGDTQSNLFCGIEEHYK